MDTKILSFQDVYSKKKQELEMAKPGIPSMDIDNDNVDNLIEQELQLIKTNLQPPKKKEPLIKPIIKTAEKINLESPFVDKDEYNIRQYYLKKGRSNEDIERIINNWNVQKERKADIFKNIPKDDKNDYVDKLANYGEVVVDTIGGVFGKAKQIAEKRIEKTAGTLEEMRSMSGVSGNVSKKLGLTLRLAGDVLGTFNDAIGEIISPVLEYSASGYKGMYEALPANVKKGISNQLTEIAKSDIGKSALTAFSNGAKSIEQWIKDNPEQAKVAEAVIEIASLPIAYGAGKTGIQATKNVSKNFVETAVKGTQKITKPLETKIATALDKQLAEEAKTLLNKALPTKKELQKIAERGNITYSTLRGYELSVDKLREGMINASKNIVNPKKDLTWNINKLQESISKLNNDNFNILEKYTEKKSKGELMSYLNTLGADAKAPFKSDDAARKAYDDMIEWYTRDIKDNDNLSNIFRSRQLADRGVQDIIDSDKMYGNIRKQAVNDVRSAIESFIKDSVSIDDRVKLTKNLSNEFHQILSKKEVAKQIKSLNDNVAKKFANYFVYHPWMTLSTLAGGGVFSAVAGLVSPVIILAAAGGLGVGIGVKKLQSSTLKKFILSGLTKFNKVMDKDIADYAKSASRILAASTGDLDKNVPVTMTKAEVKEINDFVNEMIKNPGKMPETEYVNLSLPNQKMIIENLGQEAGEIAVKQIDNRVPITGSMLPEGEIPVSTNIATTTGELTPLELKGGTGAIITNKGKNPPNMKFFKNKAQEQVADIPQLNIPAEKVSKRKKGFNQPETAQTTLTNSLTKQANQSNSMGLKPESIKDLQTTRHLFHKNSLKVNKLNEKEFPKLLSSIKSTIKQTGVKPSKDIEEIYSNYKSLLEKGNKTQGGRINAEYYIKNGKLTDAGKNLSIRTTEQINNIVEDYMTTLEKQLKTPLIAPTGFKRLKREGIELK